MLLKDLQGKKILILGFGKEGIDNYLALRRLFPGQIFGIADKKEIKEFDKKTQGFLKKNKKIKLHLGNNYLKNLNQYDIILRTPGIPDKVFKKFVDPQAKITSQTEIFFDNFDGIIIGITGTKGKGTTASLIFNILKTAGIKTKLLGNIGQPVLQSLITIQKAKGKKPIIIYELSSHQLQGLKKSPCIAVFLNLFKDHLDYYRSFNEYQKAKENIFIHQTKSNLLIYNADDPILRKIVLKSKAKKIGFSKKHLANLKKIISLKDIPLKGDFNYLNVLAAIIIAKQFNISDKKIKQSIKNFKGLEHRLEFIGKYRSIEFYNDSMATIPEVATLALKAFKGNTATLIVGGSDKGSDYHEFAKEIVKNKVKNLIILGRGTGEKILELAKLTPRKKFNYFLANSMKEAVKIAYQKTPKGKVCLLSPGSASFNLFQDYQDRGSQFKKYVKQYAKNS